MIYRSRRTIIAIDDEGIIITTRRGIFIFRVEWNELKVRWNEVVNVGVVIEKKSLTIRRNVPLPPRGHYRLPFPLLFLWPDPYVHIDLSAFTENDAKALLEELLVRQIV